MDRPAAGKKVDDGGPAPTRAPVYSESDDIRTEDEIEEYTENMARLEQLIEAYGEFLDKKKNQDSALRSLSEMMGNRAATISHSKSADGLVGKVLDTCCTSLGIHSTYNGSIRAALTQRLKSFRALLKIERKRSVTIQGKVEWSTVRKVNIIHRTTISRYMLQSCRKLITSGTACAEELMLLFSDIETYRSKLIENGVIKEQWELSSSKRISNPNRFIDPAPKVVTKKKKGQTSPRILHEVAQKVSKTKKKLSPRKSSPRNTREYNKTNRQSKGKKSLSISLGSPNSSSRSSPRSSPRNSPRGSNVKPPSPRGSSSRTSGRRSGHFSPRKSYKKKSPRSDGPASSSPPSGSGFKQRIVNRAKQTSKDVLKFTKKIRDRSVGSIAHSHRHPESLAAMMVPQLPNFVLPEGGDAAEMALFETFLTAEHSFLVECLAQIKDVFISNIQSHHVKYRKVDEPLLMSFDAIEQMFDLHMLILQDSLEAWKQFPDAFAIPEVYLQHSESLQKIYSRFFMVRTSGLSCVRRIMAEGKRSSSLHSLIFSGQTKCDLDAAFDKPMQRLVAFVWFFSELSQCSTLVNTNIDYALTSCKRLKNSCIEISVTSDQRQRVAAVEAEIVGYPGKLCTPYRSWVYDGEMCVIDAHSGEKSAAYLFHLLDDILLCVDSVNFALVESFWLVECVVQGDAGDNHQFSLRYRKKLYTLRCGSESEAAGWISKLTSLVNAASAQRQFGISASSLLDKEGGNTMPYFFYHCLAALRRPQIFDPYLFTTETDALEIDEAKAALRKGFLRDDESLHCIARLLLEWLSSLPQPVLPNDRCAVYLAALSESELPEDHVETGKALLLALKHQWQRAVLAAVIQLMCEISSVKAVSLTHLSLIFSPALCRNFSSWTALLHIAQNRVAIFGETSCIHEKLRNPYQSDVSMDTVRCSGSLEFKLAKNANEWKARYCVLKRKTLIVYIDQTMADRELEIPLDGASVMMLNGGRDNKHAFEIILAGVGRSFFFLAENSQTKTDWLAAIEEASG